MPSIPPVVVHYQPVVALDSGEVAGAEALVRFVREDGSLASPEEGGLIDRIEASPELLEEMMDQLLVAIARDIRPLFDEHPRFYVGINIPPITLGSGMVKRLVKEHGLQAYVSRFIAEITERQAINEKGYETLAQARSNGIRVAVDDFGTGKSGLLQLLGVEFDSIKIDKSQISPLPSDPLAARLLRGVVSLAGALNARVTAEGVETADQAFFLMAAGVDYGQGWYWSKALPIEGFREALGRGFAKSLTWRESATP